MRLSTQPKRDGLVREVGLSNVAVGQIEEVLRIVEVSAVQVELSVLADLALRNGVAESCRRHGVRLIALSPRPLPPEAHSNYRSSFEPPAADEGLVRYLDPDDIFG